ncbi:MAG: hypothetical protein OEZ18_03800 [Candidatus Bathyarchaeota archaeon]|nr:hypothetical protein [Candidatus Bathyarchaeota archaeon]
MKGKSEKLKVVSSAPSQNSKDLSIRYAQLRQEGNMVGRSIRVGKPLEFCSIQLRGF